MGSAAVHESSYDIGFRLLLTMTKQPPMTVNFVMMHSMLVFNKLNNFFRRSPDDQWNPAAPGIV